MGFFDDIGNFMKSAESDILRNKYRVRTPSDAVSAADRIIYGRESESVKASNLRPLVAWLNRLAGQGDSEAEDALRDIQRVHRDFLNEHDIDIEIW